MTSPATSRRTSLLAALRLHGSLIKVAHSVFALPFALLSLLVATRGRPAPLLLLLVVLAVVAARTAAMAYNRFADRDVDALNPRTTGREIPRGAIPPRAALALALGAGAAFVACCVALNPLCAALSLPVLAFVLLYSHAKRFTALCHAWLGTALGIAPVAAHVAATGTLDAAALPAVVLGAGVACWVAGFDILYACQDEAFDRRHGLHSVPAALGARRAMHVARALHLVAFAGFATFGVLAGLHRAWPFGLLLAAALLVWQHRLLAPTDLTRIDMAFFTANGALSVLLFAAGCIDVYLFFAA